jgi:hypothetical protein
MILTNIRLRFSKFYETLFIIFLTQLCAEIYAQQSDALARPPNSATLRQPKPHSNSAPIYQSGEVIGKLHGDALNEVSGLAASRSHPGLLWIHNDSGDPGHVYLIDESGKLKGIFNVNEHTIDCEDIAIGSGPDKSKSYVYLADIGDNHAKRICVAIYRFPEPAIPSEVTDGKHGHKLQDVQKFLLKYPDGSRDAETLMVDPISKNIYIVSKREKSAHIYSALLPDIPKDTIIMKEEGKIPFKRFVGGDISPDGKEILMKNYSAIYYWTRKNSTSVPATLKEAPMKLPYDKEKQGEAIGYAIDKEGFYTISEGKHSAILFYKKNLADSSSIERKVK